MTDLLDGPSFGNAKTWPEYLTACGLTHPSPLLTCLPVLLNALTVTPHLDTLLEALPYDKNGIGAFEFINIMKVLDFKQRHFMLALLHLDGRVLPSLFIRKDGHVFVLLGLKDQVLNYFDGQSNEYQTLLLDEMDPDLWTGETFVFTKIDKHEDQKVGSWFQRALSKFKLLKFQLYVIQFTLTTVSLGAPLYVMVIYNTVIPSESYQTLFNITLGAGVVLGTLLLLQHIQDRIFSYLGTKLDLDAGHSMLCQIFSMPLVMLEDASIIQQLAKIQKLDSLKDVFTNRTVDLYLNALFSFIFLLVIYFMAGWLVWIPIVTLIIAVLMGLGLWSLLKDQMQKLGTCNAEQQALWMDMIYNLSIIKYTNSEDQWLKKIKEISASQSFAAYKLDLTSQTITACFDTLITFSAIITLGFGALNILERTLSVGSLVATMMVLWSVLNPIRSLFTLLSRTDQWMSTLKQMNQLMHLETEPLSLLQNSQSPLTGKITMVNASFRYSNGTDPIILGLNLEFKPGQLVTITGPEGNGSSTIFKLFLKLYTAQVGHIQMDGFDVRQFNLHFLRHQISYETHDSAFFDGSIEENLLLMKPDASLSEIQDILKLVNLSDFILTLPHGLKSPLKQYQQLKIPDEFLNQFRLARVLLRSAPIICIDELLDYVSPLIQAKIIPYLLNQAKTKTIIISSSRLSILSKSDRIVVLDRGKLIADGPTEMVLKEELLQRYFMVINEQEQSFLQAPAP